MNPFSQIIISGLSLLIGCWWIQRLNASPSVVVFHRVTVGFLLGFIAWVGCILTEETVLDDYGIFIQQPGKTFVYSASLSLLAILVCKWHSSNKLNKAGASGRKTRLNTLPSIGWFIYLLGYESLLRGFLLFSLLPRLDTALTILTNTVVYAAAHLPKNRREIMLSIPFGVLLCVITIHTGNIWSAVVIHTALAFGSEYYAVPRDSIEFTSYSPYEQTS